MSQVSFALSIYSETLNEIKCDRTPYIDLKSIMNFNGFKIWNFSEPFLQVVVDFRSSISCSSCRLNWCFYILTIFTSAKKVYEHFLFKYSTIYLLFGWAGWIGTWTVMIGELVVVIHYTTVRPCGEIGGELVLISHMYMFSIFYIYLKKFADIFA